jgi:hypothetical protein
MTIFAASSAFGQKAGRDGANFDEAAVPPYTLPDPLVMQDGSPVRDAADWRSRRRPELLELFSREVYGRTPSGRPADMHWEVTSIDRAALGGKAVRKEVTIWFSKDKSGPRMSLLIYQPAGDSGTHTPWPAFLGLNFYGNSCVHADPGIALPRGWINPNERYGIVDGRATDKTRGVQANRWDVETVISRGYATATIFHGDLCEDRPEGLDADVAKLLGTGGTESRRSDEWGALGIWAWGLSRALDYMESDPEIDARRVAVHGHSRMGKAALWAGAQDERFALVISNNSGCGGAALSKRDFGEAAVHINTRFPYWFAPAFRVYNNNEATLPVDQHELLALIAPRPIYVASAVEDRWADPLGEFLSVKGAEPVYALFGKGGLGVDAHPPVDKPARGDALAYHIRSGDHDITPYDWAQYLDFADRVMR